jgi:ABC-type dipeptide/oligopeptide/nickel transport system ATPase component
MDVALYLADRILVMKDGEIVEQVVYHGDTSCFNHPYSRLLLKAMMPGA